MAERNFIQRLMKHLKWKRHIYVPTTMTFVPLDPAEIRDELELEKRARERGTRNQPPANSETNDDVESEIIALIEQHREIAAHNLHDNLSTYAERLNSLDLDGPAVEIGIEAKAVLGEFQKELSGGVDLAYDAKQQAIQLDGHLKNFKSNAGLDAPAHYPSAYWLHIGVLVVLLAVEAILNGFFLGETHTVGLLGGFTEAIIIAIINVGFGAVAGYGPLRFCFHKSFWVKFIGLVGMALYVAFIFGFNLAVAHYRDALSSGDWDNAQIAALQSMLANPRGIEDIKSWLLFLVGLSFSFIALIDGFRMDDRYPGYGSLTRRTARAWEKYRLIKEDCLEDLSNIKKEAVAAMLETKKEIGENQGLYGSIVEGRQRLVESYTNHLKGLEEVGNNLLAFYRTTNSAHRTEPPPKRFNERWRMDAPPAPVFGELDQRKRDASVQRVNNVLEKQIDIVEGEYRKALRVFKRIDELSEEEIAGGSAETIIKAA